MRKTNHAMRAKMRRIAARIDPIERLRRTAIRSCNEPLSRDQIRDMQIAYHGALAKVVSGTGDLGDIGVLSACANLAMLLCELDFGREYLPQVLEAQDACVVASHRAHQTGRVTLSGPAIKALQTLVELSDAQIELPECTVAVMAGAVDECNRRLKAGETISLEPA